MLVSSYREPISADLISRQTDGPTGAQSTPDAILDRLRNIVHVAVVAAVRVGRIGGLVKRGISAGELENPPLTLPGLEDICDALEAMIPEIDKSLIAIEEKLGK